MSVEEEVDNSSFESCTCCLVEMEACACNLCSCFGVKNTEVCTDVPMSLGFKIKCVGFTPAADFNIVAVILADRNFGVGNVGELLHNFLLLLFKLAKAYVT